MKNKQKLRAYYNSSPKFNVMYIFMIKKIKFSKKTQSISENFFWENIPKFAVICGINGSGKSQILNVMSTKGYDQLGIAKTSDNCELRYQNFTIYASFDVRNFIYYVPVDKNPSIDLSAHRNSEDGSFSRQESIRNSAVKSIKSNDSNVYVNEIKSEISQKEGVSVSEISKLSESKILEYIPFDHGIKLDFDNRHIASIFKAYLTAQVSINNRKNRPPLPEPPPWVLINKLFKKYDFFYQINEPELEISYVPSFSDKEGNSICFSDLSTGEKLIVSLIMWAYDQKISDNKKILLLDEFDAHLNPSMSKLFVDILQDTLVEKFDIQVIVTTHSPSTVAYVDDENLFWMERGQNIKKR